MEEQRQALEERQRLEAEQDRQLKSEQERILNRNKNARPRLAFSFGSSAPAQK